MAVEWDKSAIFISVVDVMSKTIRSLVRPMNAGNAENSLIHFVILSFRRIVVRLQLLFTESGEIKCETRLRPNRRKDYNPNEGIGQWSYIIEGK